MPFTSETAKQLRGPGGRRRNRDKEAEIVAGQLVKDILDRNAARLGNRWVGRALGKNGDKVLMHAIDKLMPDEQIQPQAPVINVLIAAQVSGNQSQPELRANGIQISLGGINGRNGNGGNGS
jgi:hypothetical protein